MRKRILEGPPFSPEEREEILIYCASDVDETIALLPKLLAEPDFDLGIALHWGEFAAVSALMEHRGIPLDMEIVPQLLDKKAWAFVRDAVVPKIDAQYGVYIQDAAGEWHFSIEKFEALCVRLGIDWPRLESGKLDLRRKTFESMCKAYPELEALRQLRYARDKLRRIKLAVGSDGRNRTVLWPFASKTSRTQPKASRWIFSPAVWLRSLIKPDLVVRSPISTGHRWNFRLRLCSPSASRCSSCTRPAAHTSNLPSASMWCRNRPPRRRIRKCTTPTKPFCSAHNT